MSYQVFCTFDLKNASSTDYQNAYSDLESIGLKKVQAGNSGDVVIPTTSALGTFTGADSPSVRDHVRAQVKAAFTRRKFKSEIFVAVGENGTWGSATT